MVKNWVWLTIARLFLLVKYGQDQWPWTSLKPAINGISPADLRVTNQCDDPSSSSTRSYEYWNGSAWSFPAISRWKFQALSLYGLVNIQKTNWKDPPCYQWVNIHYFDWAMFNSYVCLPEGNCLSRRWWSHAIVSIFFSSSCELTMKNPLNIIGLLQAE